LLRFDFVELKTRALRHRLSGSGLEAVSLSDLALFWKATRVSFLSRDSGDTL
jgi:hypothetical protein